MPELRQGVLRCLLAGERLPGVLGRWELPMPWLYSGRHPREGGRGGMRVFVPYSAIVRCAACSYPIHLGSGFWHKQKGQKIAGKLIEGKHVPLCGRCSPRLNGPYTPNVRQTPVEIVPDCLKPGEEEEE